MKPIQKFAMLLTILSVLAFGCEKEAMGPGGTVPEDGTFKAYMTDSPGDYEAVDVEIVRVDAYIEGSGWVNVNNSSRIVNVLSLTNGAQTELTSSTSASSKAGVYTKLRIVFGTNNHVRINAAAALALGGSNGGGAATFDLQFVGNHEHELVIDERVNARTGAAVLVDFDVARSVYYDMDHFVLRPALSIVKDGSTGVRGHVSGALTAAVTLSNESASFSTYINAQGDFLIRGMKEGVYTLKAVRGRVLSDLQDPQPKEITGVVVVDGEITSVGTISF